MKKNKGKRSAGKHCNSYVQIKHRSDINNPIKNTNNHITKKKSNLVLNIITIICIIAIIFSSYNIVCWFIENKNNNALLSDIYKETTITEEQISINGEYLNKLHYDFTNLLSKNQNTIGWINMRNTNINYPVVQYTDNDYYLNHSFDNKANSAGWIFADYKNKCDNSDYNMVIYGHNRKDKTMFGSLKNVLNSEWYLNEENLYINFSTLNEDHVYKIFSTFVCNAANVNSYTKTEFTSDDEFNSYLQNLKKLSSYDFNTNIENTNHIITLYTCYGLNNQRLLVCAKLID